MSEDDLVRAWKDPDHRDGDVDHPAGEINLVDLDHVGGVQTEYLFTIGCCVGVTGDWYTCAFTTNPVNCHLSLAACPSYAVCPQPA